MSTQTDLDQAKAARHKLLTGTATVEVRTEEGTVKYNAADLVLLDAYIARLTREVSGQTSRAIGVRF
jgi:hypothetical protein